MVCLQNKTSCPWQYQSPKINRWTKEQVNYIQSLDNNKQHCCIAQQIIRCVHVRGLFQPGTIYKASSVLSLGVLMGPHSGVFSLSLDRMDNNKSHFLEGKNVLANVHLTVLV